MYNIQALNPQCITPLSNGWEQYLVHKDDATGKWGDSPTTPLRRSQYTSVARMKAGDSYAKTIGFMIFDDWEFHPTPTFILGTHGGAMDYNTFYAHMYGDELVFGIKKVDPVVNIHSQGIVVATGKVKLCPYRPIQVKMSCNFRADNTGNCVIWVDGVEVAAAYGFQSYDPADVVGQCLELGPYIFNPWPYTKAWRRCAMLKP